MAVSLDLDGGEIIQEAHLATEITELDSFDAHMPSLLARLIYGTRCCAESIAVPSYLRPFRRAINRTLVVEGIQETAIRLGWRFMVLQPVPDEGFGRDTIYCVGFRDRATHQFPHVLRGFRAVASPGNRNVVPGRPLNEVRESVDRDSGQRCSRGSREWRFGWYRIGEDEHAFVTLS